MKAGLIAYLSAGIAMLGLDAIWLSVAAGRLYRPAMGNMLLPDFHPAPAALFYALYVLGVVVFVVRPAIAAGQIGAATVRGALFGLVAYATYDLTNQATLRNWPMAVTVADLCWGTILTACVASISYWVTTMLCGRR